MHKLLEEILNKTKQDLAKRKKEVSLGALEKTIGDLNSRSFISAIRNPRKGTIAIIAEVKFASPLEPHLGFPDSLIARIKQYEEANADAISIVTEKHFFKGDPSYISKIREVSSLPVLQKDFIVDSYQVYEAKKAGADAILLIAKIVTRKRLVSLVKQAMYIGLEAVVEVNSQDDLKKSMATQAEIIAVNARDLDSFEVDVDRACELLKMIPDKFLRLGFSGVTGKAEVEKYKQAEADGILIGTSLMKTDNIKEFIGRIESISKLSSPTIRPELMAEGLIRDPKDMDSRFRGNDKRDIEMNSRI